MNASREDYPLWAVLFLILAAFAGLIYGIAWLCDRAQGLALDQHLTLFSPARKGQSVSRVTSRPSCAENGCPRWQPGVFRDRRWAGEIQ